jgi:hypothetical protein
MKAEDIRTVVRLARLGFEAEAIRKLSRISASLHRLGVRQCNGEGWGLREFENGRWFARWTDADDNRCEASTLRLFNKAGALCNEAGDLFPYHQGDPRGCSLYIIPKSELNGREVASVYSSIGVAV